MPARLAAIIACGGEPARFGKHPVRSKAAGSSHPQKAPRRRSTLWGINTATPHTAAFEDGSETALFQRPPNGFTLIEMVVVIVIISMAMMLVLPRLPSTAAGELRSSARSLAATFRYLGDQAVATKTHYRMRLGIDDGSITVTRFENRKETAVTDNFLAKRSLAEDISIEDVQIPRLGTIIDGEAVIDFGSRGLAEFVTVHLKGEKGAQMTIMAFPDSGKVKVAEGYQEVRP
ncbi:prepilin-type N-terminal cleavage/methylation domain-containing protein [Geobacter sp. DSM 9736]|uniref:prepilin-type N-terminal cleavage/methylation domain-containing protein n=1 Tax=Geobacter sp. DSM 9736 TaxID=1277350 RepID=UPI000B5EDBB5|nr:prepilin-type N-terminal cleavage/methylation domain-containing protein [Geobacter sp. DSM 9736]SNB47417.1 general secretion pathway protein H [Geobacter sp. DSM 9736]